MRGQYTCWAHGGASPQARAWGEARLWRDRFWVQAARIISDGLRKYDARLRADPEAVQAETLARLSQANEQIKQFRRVHGRRPRRSELAGILDTVGW
jgi:hypothetical protein